MVFIWVMVGARELSCGTGGGEDIIEVWAEAMDGAEDPGGGVIFTDVWNKGMKGGEDRGGGDIIKEAEFWRGGMADAEDRGGAGGEKLLLTFGTDIVVVVAATAGPDCDPGRGPGAVLTVEVMKAVTEGRVAGITVLM